jgi:hypothetical protein
MCRGFVVFRSCEEEVQDALAEQRSLDIAQHLFRRFLRNAPLLVSPRSNQDMSVFFAMI